MTPATHAAGRVSRLVLGRDAHARDDGQGQVWLEGRVRLCPGQRVLLIAVSRGGPRQVRVLDWTIARLTPTGPIYSGRCRDEP